MQLTLTFRKQPLRVAIVGGGIGGLTAALAFRRIGADVHVYERAPEIRESEPASASGPTPSACSTSSASGRVCAASPCQ